MKLYEYGELNQSKLMSFCGLNNVTHKEIVDDMVQQGFLERREEKWGKKMTINYKIAQSG